MSVQSLTSCFQGNVLHCSSSGIRLCLYLKHLIVFVFLCKKLGPFTPVQKLHDFKSPCSHLRSKSDGWQPLNQSLYLQAWSFLRLITHSRLHLTNPTSCFYPWLSLQKPRFSAARCEVELHRYHQRWASCASVYCAVICQRCGYTFYYGKLQTNKSDGLSSLMKPSSNAYQRTAHLLLSIFQILLDYFEADLKNIVLSPWRFLTEPLSKSWLLQGFPRNCYDISQM